ncbi:MAG: hypothetical protein NZ853_06410 [Leptospiraceae bacterium]|nr:hypothetical protein [Leptospiraceae bacterium]MDW7976416.1 hypothetical protein [Leptospiraceae bacterium]
MSWKETFRIHLVRMEKLFQKYHPPFKNDVKVYLAGYLARYTDNQYIKQIQPYIRDLDEIKHLVMKHHHKLGQKSILVFYAKVNAEYKMFQLTKEMSQSKSQTPLFISLQIKEPASLFSLASTYSQVSGKLYQAFIYEVLYKRIWEVLELLSEYMKSLYLEKSEPLTIRIEELTEEELKDFNLNFKKILNNDIKVEDFKKSINDDLLNNFFHLS